MTDTGNSFKKMLSIKVVILFSDEYLTVNKLITSLRCNGFQHITIVHDSKFKFNFQENIFDEINIVHNHYVDLWSQRQIGLRSFVERDGIVLFLEADEEVTTLFADEIKILVNNKNIFKNNYFIPRKNIVFGKALLNGGWYPDLQDRLFNYENWAILDYPMSTFINSVNHYSHQSLSEWYSKFLKSTAIKSDYYNDASILDPITNVWIRLFDMKGYKDGFIGIVTILYLLLFHITYKIRHAKKD